MPSPAAAWSRAPSPRRFLRSADGPLRYGREIGYGWYLAHQPVIVAIAFLVVPWRAAVATKFGVLFGASLVATLGVAELFRRVTPLRVVLGMPIDEG